MTPGDLLKLLLFLTGAYIWGRAFLVRHWAGWWPPARPAGAVLVGWHLMALLALLLGHFGLFRYAPWLIAGVTPLLLWRPRPKSHFSLPVSPSDTALLVTCFLAAYLLARLVLPFGLPGPDGLHIYGAHYIDSTWHLSLINELTRSVPPQNPIFAGTPLTNYHYLVDLQLALVRLFTGISVPVIFFRLAPVVIFTCVSLLVAALGISLSGKKTAGVFSVLFFLIGSNLYYLAPRFFPSPASWPSAAWVDVYSTLGVNYPLTVSIALLCVIWLLLGDRPLPVAKLVLLVSTLLLVKSHTSLVLLGALGLYGLYTWWQKLGYKILLIAILSAVVVYGLTFLIIGRPNESLALSPFWFVRTMFTSPDRLNSPNWELARQYLLAHPGHLGLIRLYIEGLGWFVFFNLGPLVLGLIFGRRYPLVWGLSASGFVLTMTFIYTGTAIVTIQFFYLAVFALSLGTALLLARLSRLPALLAGLVLWLVLLPGVIYTQNQYRAGAGRMDLSADELKLAQVVASWPSGSQLLDPAFRNGSWFTAYSGHPAYLGDFQTLPPLGLDTSAREAKSRAWLSCATPARDLGVTFLVTLPDSCWHDRQDVRPVFTNPAGSVFSVL